MNPMYYRKQLPHKKLHITADKGSCQSSIVRYKQSRNSFKKTKWKVQKLPISYYTTKL